MKNERMEKIINAINGKINKIEDLFNKEILINIIINEDIDLGKNKNHILKKIDSLVINYLIVNDVITKDVFRNVIESLTPIHKKQRSYTKESGFVTYEEEFADDKIISLEVQNLILNKTIIKDTTDVDKFNGDFFGAIGRGEF